MRQLIVITLSLLMLSCTSTGLQVLEGATHACGTLHVEGYLTDTQGEVVIVKAPDNWTADQIKEFCGDH